MGWESNVETEIVTGVKGREGRVASPLEVSEPQCVVTLEMGKINYTYNQTDKYAYFRPTCCKALEQCFSKDDLGIPVVSYVSFLKFLILIFRMWQYVSFANYHS